MSQYMCNRMNHSCIAYQNKCVFSIAPIEGDKNNPFVMFDFKSWQIVLSQKQAESQAQLDSHLLQKPDTQNVNCEIHNVSQSTGSGYAKQGVHPNATIRDVNDQKHILLFSG
jgi:alpha-acetolactate decarboxylase